MHCLCSWNICSFVTRQFQTSFQVHFKGLEVKNSSQTSWHVSVAVLGEKLLQNNQSLRNFCLWGCKEAALLLIWHNCLFYVEKCCNYADADVSKVCRSVSPNPVRCPVKRVKDISYNLIVFEIFCVQMDTCGTKFLRPFGNL